MFLKIGGNTKVPTSTVMREFQKRGLDVSLEQLQQLFPQGNNFLKNITSSFVEFNTNQTELQNPLRKHRITRQKLATWR